MMLEEEISTLKPSIDWRGASKDVVQGSGPFENADRCVKAMDSSPIVAVISSLLV